MLKGKSQVSVSNQQPSKLIYDPFNTSAYDIEYPFELTPTKLKQSSKSKIVTQEETSDYSKRQKQIKRKANNLNDSVKELCQSMMTSKTSIINYEDIEKYFPPE